MKDAPCVMLMTQPALYRSAAFERAVALAKAQGLPLHIVACNYIKGLSTDGRLHAKALLSMRDDYFKANTDWLNAELTPLENEGINVTTETLWTEPSISTVLKVVNARPVNMLVKEVKPENLFKRAMFTTLDLHLLYECPVPIHFVSDTAAATPRKIVAAVDPFHPNSTYRALNDHIIAQAIAIGALYNAQVHLLYAHDQSSPSVREQGYAFDSLLFSPHLAEKLSAAQSETFRELADRYAIAFENRHLIMGNPAKVLRQFAEAYDVDMIILGRLNPLQAGKRVGSTVEHLLNHVPGSLLIIASEVPLAEA